MGVHFSTEEQGTCEVGGKMNAAKCETFCYGDSDRQSLLTLLYIYEPKESLIKHRSVLGLDLIQGFNPPIMGNNHVIGQCLCWCLLGEVSIVR